MAVANGFTATRSPDPDRPAGGASAARPVRFAAGSAWDRPVDRFHPITTVALMGFRHLAQGQIQPPPLRQEVRRARQEAVDPVENQTAGPTEHNRVTGAQSDRAGRIRAVLAAIAE